MGLLATYLTDAQVFSRGQDHKVLAHLIFSYLICAISELAKQYIIHCNNHPKTEPAGKEKMAHEGDGVHEVSILF